MIAIAITGTNGFLGGELMSFLKKKFDIIPIYRDELSNGNEKFASFNSQGSILKGVDFLVHCAAKVHDFEKSEGKNYIKYFNSNLLLTQKLFKEAQKNKVKRFIFISTIKVNGEITKKNQPFSSKSPNRPIDPYAKSKFEAEKKLLKMSQNSEMELVIIRCPLIYGPGVKANFYNMLKLINTGVPLPFGSINNSRSIIFIGNLVRFIEICLFEKKAANKRFLISDKGSISTKNLVKTISNNLNSKNLIFKFPVKFLLFFGRISGKYQQINKIVSSLEINYSESHEYLNWHPPFSTNYGLKKTTDWFKKKASRNL